MQTKLLGFGYRRRQGKDTAVQAIIDHYSHLYDIRRYAFAGALKVELYDAFHNTAHPFWKFTNFPTDFATQEWKCLPTFSQIDAEKVAWCDDHKSKVREYAQFYGTEFRRAIDPWYWIKKLAARIEEEKPQFALIPDCRFGNEVGWVRGHSGAVAKVERLGYIHDDGEGREKHISENQLDGMIFDYGIFVEDGRLDKLKERAVNVFDRFLRGHLGDEVSSVRIGTVQGNRRGAFIADGL